MRVAMLSKLDADPASPHLVSNSRSRAGAERRIEDEIAGLDYPEMGVEAYPKDASFSAQDVVISQLPKAQQEELAGKS